MPKYCLEIYEPGQVSDVLCSWDSDTPFHTYNVGDLVQTTAVRGYAGGATVLQVVRVEHMIFGDTGAPIQKACVYTKTVDNTAEARLGEPS